MPISTMAFGRALRSEWGLDPELTYLNHGTVGATPRRVLDAQQAIRDAIEREPARFLLRDLADVQQGPMRVVPHMRVAAAKVAAFVRCRPEDLVFVDNATTGVNAVLRSLSFTAGDEIVITDHGYGAVAHISAYVARRTGAVVRVVELPGPPWDADAIVAAITSALGARTKILIVDHITSGSALILAVRRIVERSHAVGVPVLVDGAHALGALDLDIPALGADWYTGNLHKWAMAPRSSAILWAGPERQRDLHPPVISWGLDLGFTAEFDLTGTRDPSPWLASPDGLTFMEWLGLDAMRRWNHALVWDAARELGERWDMPLPSQESMIGSMVTLPLPARVRGTSEAVQALRDALLFEDRIEVQMHAWKDRAWARLCGQVYVERADLERFVSAIEKRW